MKKIIIQAALTETTGFTVNNPFLDMMRLIYQRHAAYSRAHNYDYWHIIGSMYPEMKGGGWDKIDLIRRAMELGYQYIVWIDSDAAIMDLEAELTDALPEGKDFGAVLHDPAKSEFLKSCEVPSHCNVGVTYWRNTELTQRFVLEWFASHPGEERWVEQGSFNKLIADDRYKDAFHVVDDTYNATVNVNEVDKPVVKGWHGIMPPVKRLNMMKKELGKDFLKYRV
jgi:hypothetical protein